MGYADYEIAGHLKKIANSLDKIANTKHVTYNVIVVSGPEDIEKAVADAVERLENRKP